MDELIFIGMDVVEETEKIINSTKLNCTRGMTEGELSAYNLGIANTLSLLRGILYTDCENEFVLHFNGFEMPTEFTHDDLIRYVDDLMETC